jgi:hypothetical protein
MASASPCLQAPSHERHRPELTPLHQITSSHWPRFVERADSAGGLPVFVQKEFEAYLDCGIAGKGCVILHCPNCGLTKLVAFSCKHRGFCPSCLGRRMNDLAVHLVDDVLPRVRIRQWICTMPWSLRLLLGYNRELCSAVLSSFVSELARSYRFRAKHRLGLRSVRDAHFGAVTIIQRFDSALRLNPHPHTLALDGVYTRDPSGALSFHELPPPTHEEVATVASRTASRVERILHHHGIDPDDDSSSDLSVEQPVLTQLLLASAHGIDLFGERAMMPSLRLVTTPPPQPTHATPLPLAEVRGFNVHARTHVDGRDRNALERLCRYVARPPVATERLHIQSDGRVRYELKRVWADGTEAIVLDPLSFLARLSALVPPPYFNLTRYHGVLAARSKLRHEVVERATHATPSPEEQLLLPCLPQVQADQSRRHPDTLHRTRSPDSHTPGRHPWAYLLRRTFKEDVTVCPSCSGPLRLEEVCTDREAIARALLREGLGPMPPPPVLPGITSAQLTMQI